jgi:hypothetical protein
MVQRIRDGATQRRSSNPQTSSAILCGLDSNGAQGIAAGRAKSSLRESRGVVVRPASPLVRWERSKIEWGHRDVQPLRALAESSEVCRRARRTQPKVQAGRASLAAVPEEAESTRRTQSERQQARWRIRQGYGPTCPGFTPLRGYDQAAAPPNKLAERVSGTRISNPKAAHVWVCCCDRSLQTVAFGRPRESLISPKSSRPKTDSLHA